MNDLYLKNLTATLKNLEIIPLYGFPPTFSIEAYGQALSSTFKVSPFEIEVKKTDFYQNILEGMGASPLIRPFVLSPLPEEFFLVIPKSQVPTLVKSLMSEGKIQKSFSDETLEQSFIQVSLLVGCQTFNELNSFEGLLAGFADPCPPPEEGALCHDLSIKIGTETIIARLVCTLKGLSAFRSFYESKQQPLSLDSKNIHLPISLSYEVGKTNLSLSEWQKANVGDCVLLDRCSIDLEKEKGTAILTLNSTPLFDVRLKGSEAKIIDYVMTQKEIAMTDESPVPPQTPEENDQELSVEPEIQPLPAGEIPLTLTVELDRFEMPLEKVMQLKPGNTLELCKNKNLHINLTVNGKCIATGELVRLGEATGVKILKLGS